MTHRMTSQGIGSGSTALLPQLSGSFFFVIGAMKAGTSSIYKHLASHPSIYAAPRKEPRFFSNPCPTEYDVAAYKALFAGRTSESWAFEASTAYTKYPMIPGVADRIHNAFPDARVIYVIRDPVERICSAYLHNRAEGREQRSLEDAIWDSAQEYLNVSRYYLQISQYLRVFPRDRLLVLVFEEFIADVDATLAEVARFLDLESGFHPVGTASRYNETSKKRASLPIFQPLSRLLEHRAIPWRMRSWALRRLTRPLPSRRDILGPRLRNRILEELGTDLAQLKGFLGRDLNCWDLSCAGSSESGSRHSKRLEGLGPV
jgi:hypothetical protein